jgi:hypothetical protein
MTFPSNSSVNKSDLLAQKAIKVAESGKKENILVRVAAACAVRIHCPESGRLLDEMQRTVNDLDFFSLSKHEDEIPKFFAKLGYDSSGDFSKYYAHLYGVLRNRFKDPETGVTLDVFYDKLEMSHRIDLRKRLELDFPTITVSDLLLAKMQIVKINKKDIEDTLILLKDHDLAESDSDSINTKYISQVLTDEWGFYYTFTSNLEKAKESIDSYEVLRDDAEQIRKKITSLHQIIEEFPKSTRWKLRAKVGTRQKWYADVDEVSR